ncbi:MAG: protein BatD [Saprospiraceae bacterium]|nr:protein BatD [Saprospiraceae bacterium]
MKRTLLLFAFAFFVISMFGQNEVTFKANVSRGSVLLGNGIEVLFTLEGAKGANFIPPIFEHFTVISGPNVRTMVQINNGKTKQSTVYAYYVQPNDTGLFYIEPASIEVENISLLPLFWQ